MRLVLIHLGDSNAKVMWANVLHLAQKHEQFEVDVIISEKAIIPEPIRGLVNTYEYSTNPELQSLFNQLEIDSDYRKGFWRYSLERLFAFTEHHQRFSDEALLHVESDVLLMETFPFETLSKSTKLAWSILDDERDVAALLFSPGYQSSKWMQDRMKELISGRSTINDMQLLSLISNKYPESVTILPTIPREKLQLIPVESEVSSSNKFRSYENSAFFNGIFDAAAIGIWLTGTDAVNSFGVSKRFENKLVKQANSLVDPSSMTLEYLLGSGLYIIMEDSKIAIHTLHIHSKNLKYFSSNGPKLIARSVIKSKGKRVVRRFSMPVLVNLLNDNYNKGTLLRFLSWLPIFDKYRIFREYLRKRQN